MARKRRGDRLPPFVALTWEILNSKAFKELPYATAKALPYFLGKVKTGFNDPQRYLTNFSFSYSEAKNYGFAFSTFSKVIQSLMAFGFIDPVDKGGLRGAGFSVSLFKLSERWKIYNTKEFKEINWKCFMSKKEHRSTPKIEIYNSKKGNKKAIEGQAISHYGVVEANLP